MASDLGTGGDSYIHETDILKLFTDREKSHSWGREDDERNLHTQQLNGQSYILLISGWRLEFRVVGALYSFNSAPGV